MSETAEDFGVDFMGSDDFAIQYQGQDLIHVTDLDRAAGTVRVRVFAGVDETSPVVFEGVVSVAQIPTTRKETQDA